MARQLLRVAAIAASVAVHNASCQDAAPEVPLPPKIPSETGSSQGFMPGGDRPFFRNGGGEFRDREIANFVDSLPSDLRAAVRQHWQEWVKKRAEQRNTAQPGPDSAEAKKFLQNLAPEQREKFKQNFQRWQAMPPEEREMMRLREEFRQRQVHQEVETFLNESGLKLDGPRRDQFTRRYSQERRKIEETLQKEMSEKRGPMVRELAERLKAEFSSASATPSVGR